MRQYAKTFTADFKANAIGIVLLSGACIFWTEGALADGGTVQFTKTTGLFAVTVFASPSPPRAGPLDISLMIQQSDNQQPLLDCDVEIELRKQGESSIRSKATHQAAQNKLFYAAQVRVPEPGVWEVEAAIRSGEDSTKVSGPIMLAASSPVLLSYWRSVAIPPVLISLFALNQWLKRRRTKGQKREHRSN